MAVSPHRRILRARTLPSLSLRRPLRRQEREGGLRAARNVGGIIRARSKVLEYIKAVISSRRSWISTLS